MPLDWTVLFTPPTSASFAPDECRSRRHTAFRSGASKDMRRTRRLKSSRTWRCSADRSRRAAFQWSALTDSSSRESATTAFLGPSNTDSAVETEQVWRPSNEGEDSSLGSLPQLIDLPQPPHQWVPTRVVLVHQLLTFATSRLNRHSHGPICTPPMWSQNAACANGCKFPASAEPIDPGG